MYSSSPIFYKTKATKKIFTKKNPSQRSSCKGFGLLSTCIVLRAGTPGKVSAYYFLPVFSTATCRLLPRLRLPLRLLQPWDCYPYPGSPSFYVGRIQKRIRQTGRRSAYGPWYRSCRTSGACRHVIGVQGTPCSATRGNGKIFLACSIHSFL
jgi:hypothetical protein